MARKINLMVLFGGRSGEHEVSLNSARSILAVIDPAKYAVIQVGITHDGVWLTGEDPLTDFFAGRTDGLTRVTLLPYPGSQTLYALRGSSPPEGDAKRVSSQPERALLRGPLQRDRLLQGT